MSTFNPVTVQPGEYSLQREYLPIATTPLTMIYNFDPSYFVYNFRRVATDGVSRETSDVGVIRTEDQYDHLAKQHKNRGNYRIIVVQET